jgi:tetratricopeptide (TPR) repeat protein
MNINPVKEIMKNLEDKGYKDEYLKEHKDLQEEILDCLKSTNTVIKPEPFFLFLRRFNSYTPAIPPRPRIALRGKASKEMKDGFQRFKELVGFLHPSHRLFTDVKGGGCFLSWEGKGIVIDPGFDYIENMYSEDLAIGDIDAIIITHAHNDHYTDLDSLLTLAFQYNKLSVAYHGIATEEYPDALSALEDLFEVFPYSSVFNAIAYCYVKLRRLDELRLSEHEALKIAQEFAVKLEENILPEIKEEKENGKGKYKKKRIKVFFSESARASLSQLIKILDKHKRTACLGDADGPFPLDALGEKLETELSILDKTETQHNDFKRIRGNGLIFHLDNFNLGMTSDTAWFDTDDERKYEEPNTFRKEITKYFGDCQLLIPHIGSIKKSEFNWLKISDSEKASRFKKYLYETHLGVLGLLRLTADIKAYTENKLQLVAITEFGEEMKHMRHYLAEEMDACTDIKNGTK